MSRFRNRNIRSKFSIPSTSSATTPRKNDTRGTVDSGIDVKTGTTNSYSGRGLWKQRSSGGTSGSDIDIIEEDVRDSYGKSSTSSLSWAEDYELNSTELVKVEYERMERVLQCLEPIPTHYDRDEYKLWIKTFPCLSLTGQTSSIRPPKATSGDSKTPKPKKHCDKLTSAVSSSRRDATVIDKELAVNNTINPRTLDVLFGSFLQIAPVVLPPKKSGGDSKTSKYKPNWWKDFMDDEHKRSSQNSGSSRRSDFVVLPPIEGGYVNGRSISAVVTRPTSRKKKTSADIFLKQPLHEKDELGYGYEDERKQRDRFVKLAQE